MQYIFFKSSGQILQRRHGRKYSTAKNILPQERIVLYSPYGQAKTARQHRAPHRNDIRPIERSRRTKRKQSQHESTRIRSAEKIEGLSEAERELVMQRLAKSIHAGVISVDVQDERFQERNRKIALSRIEAKITAAARIEKKRRATCPTKASRERRLKIKKLRADIKKNRGKVRE